MRLFTALELSDGARSAIAAEQTRVVAALGRSSGRLRLVKPEHLHLTLVFIGEVPEDRGAAITRTMADDIPLPPFQIAFGGIGAFPPRGAPRALFVDLLEGAEEALELHDRVSRRLAPAGVLPEARPYRPHLTLGRWRESRAADRPRETSRQAIARIDVRAVSLFQSRISSSGPSYTRLSAARLVCP